MGALSDTLTGVIHKVKAVILNGSGNDDETLDSIYNIIVNEFTDIEWEVESFILRDLKIAYCLGCFECWTKTPGVCRFDDVGREIAKRFIQSDVAVLFTPVTFGGYSSELKKALDRIICLILPFFKKKGGEVHHKPRYDRYPRLMVVGVLPQADEESERIFKTLVDRNALNFDPPAHVGGVVLSGQGVEEIQKEIKSHLAAIEVVQ